MSDSDELGGLEPTTPYIPRKRNPTSNVSDVEAGPSRKAPGPRTAAGKRKAVSQSSDAKKRRNDASSDEEEIEEIPEPPKKGKQAIKATGRANNKQEIIVEDEDEVEETENQQQTKQSKSRKAPSNLTNVAAKNKPKPKGKASSKAADLEDVMDVDEVEDLPVNEDENRVAQQELVEAINAAGRSGLGKLPSKTKATQMSDRNARLQREVDKLKDTIKDLQRQLEELHKVRNTEPELLLQRLETQLQEERQVRDTLIQNLQDQLSRQDPLLRSGKKAAFEVLTRDEANNEVKALHKQLEAYRTNIKEQQATLQNQEKLIVELQEAKKDLRTELDAEIARSHSLAIKAQHHPPPSASRQKIAPTNDDPKFGTVIRFYEDLTNLIIPNMKMFPGKHMGMDEWHLTCYYTYKDVTSEAQPSKSLSFTLRLCHEPSADIPDPKKKEDLVESVQYIPLALDRETDEFVKSLDFLNAPFTFERDQLSLFIRTLHDTLSGENNKAAQDDDDMSSNSSS
ncbi:hypothetical protein CVT24_008924 [Panaeolus cyanescens]|uniref:Monopolin complex subunit Csm1/Pcs1 C-terminal domain-containing protein n=1 Tax=Panaeolus cyanescens TaxID=181874 RepID=A0A409VES8_9AGAR|nr:hypothetical protein CVT24_008924 [Panaeolus cyanescens]